MLQAGQYLFASPLLKGDYFEGAKICLVKHDSSESIGFVVNRPSGRRLNELVEFSSAPPIALWEGGPVGLDHLYILHQRPDLISGGTPVDAGWYWGGSMDELVHALSAQIIEEGQFKLLLGYCGWDAGELNQEYNEAFWLS